MDHIKRFFDRVSALESRPGRDLVIPVSEARLLRDEVGKLLALKLDDQLNKPETEIEVQVKGGTF